MSWFIEASGTPAEIETRLKEYTSALGAGQSGSEYAAALPSLLALVGQNYTTDVGRDRHLPEPYLRLCASGSGTTYGDNDALRRCCVSLEQILPPAAAQ